MGTLRIAVFTLIGTLLQIYVEAQNYTVLGSAVQMSGCECFRLTSAANNQAGAIYQNQTINLNNSFDYTFSIFLGCNNGNGADGLMFVLTTNPNGLGNLGEGLGYAGPNQPFSFAVEFDTYQNTNVNDPSQHHIAFNSGGNYNHNVAGPVSALPNGGNIDNCQSHIVRIVWDVNTNTYSVYFNGSLRLSVVIPNIVQTYFGGNPIVNWGWTAATGGRNNEQRVCVQSISSWVAGINYQSCSPTVQFQDVSTSNVGSIQSWAWNFGDGNTSTQQNPVHTYPGNGTYNVTLVITDISGCTKSYTRPVTVAPNITLTPTLQPPPCHGGNNGNITVTPAGGFGPAAGYGGYRYNWSTGQNTPTAVGLTAGTYTVTVTDGVCTSTGQYTLDQPPPLTATITKTDPNCNLNNGSATVTVSGGTPPYQYVNWPTISPTNVASNLGPGTYIPDFRDANGCSSLLQYSVTLVNLPCGVNVSTTITNVTCFNGTNGSATLNITGGGAIKNVTWSNGATGFTISNVPQGTYTYNYSDNAGNNFAGSVTISQPAAPMVASVSTLSLSCAGRNDGSAIASVTSGGTSPFSYAWSHGAGNSPVVNNLPPGNYTVTVTDFNGCTAAASGTVSAPPPLSLTFTTTIDSCFRSGKGTATANVSGGSPPYVYQWSNIASAPTNLDLTAGNYSVTVTDQKGCSITGATTVTEAPDIVYNISIQNINCFGNATGSISVNVNGGTPGYAFAWNPPNVTGSNPTNLPAGKYVVTITDAFTCQKIDSVTLTQPTSALSVTTSRTNVTCFGANNGTITINVSGGTPPYFYQNNQIPSGSTTIGNLAPNTYSGVVRDNNDCTVSVSETITEPAPLTVTEQHVDVSCFGGNNGSINLTVNGGTLPYSFTWSDGNTNEDRSGLTQGLYSVTVRDFNNCTNTLSVNITQPTDVVVTETHQDVLCFGGSSGSIDVSVSGGTLNYSYLWNDGNTNEDRSGLSQGTYSLTVTDGNGCTKTLSVQIAQPPPLNVTTTRTNVTCFGANNGTITINVSGGTPPYFYQNNPIPPGSTTIGNLAPNTYSGVVRDNNDCTVSVSETITEPAPLTVTEQHVDVSCFGGNNGSINLTVNGGTLPYSFTWSDGNTNEDRSGLTQGVYSVTVRDFNNCTTTLSVNITQPTDVVVTETHQDVLCFGGSSGNIDVSVSGGTLNYSYLWNDGNTNEDRSGLSQGTYSLTVTDGNGCTKTLSVQIAQPPPLNVTTTRTNVTCFGANNGTITINVSGGTPPYFYQNNPIPPGSTTIGNLPPNTYSGAVRDNNDCTVSVSETITEPAPLTVTEQHVDVSCFENNDGSINITTQGGTVPYSYSWNDGSASEDRTQLVAASYTVTVSDFNNCSTSVSVQITEPAAVPLDVVTTHALCYGLEGSARAVPTVGVGNYVFAWSSGSSTTNLAQLPAGNYSVTATSANGCRQVGNFTILQPPQITLSIDKSDLTCYANNTGSVFVSANGGVGNFSYTWSPNVSNSPSATALSAGNYFITVSDGNGCTATTSVTIVEPSPVQVTTFSRPASCHNLNNGSIFSDATGGTPPYTYAATNGSDSYNSPNGTFSSLLAGNYTVVATDRNNCTASATVRVAEPTPVGYSYFTKDVSCFGFKDGVIEVIPGGGTPGYRFLRDGVETSPTGIFSGLPPGSYYIEVTDQNGCSATFTATIRQPEAISLFVDPNPISTPLGTPVEIFVSSNQSGNVSYRWQPQKGLSCYDCDRPVFDGIFSMDYRVLVTNANGCTATVPVTAEVVPDYTIYAPNLFTPNNDGVNDIFAIYGNQKAVKEFSLKVYNRWGEKVFESPSFNEGWDGKFNGKDAEPGVYVYHLKVVWIDNYHRNDFKGSVTLVR